MLKTLHTHVSSPSHINSSTTTLHLMMTTSPHGRTRPVFLRKSLEPQKRGAAGALSLQYLKCHPFQESGGELHLIRQSRFIVPTTE